MIVRRFMQWVSTAPVTERAKGAAALAQAYLYSELDEDERDEADVALTALLDDVSPRVRKALAEVLGGSAGAPRAVIVALANDQSDVSATVLRYSPLLGDSELIDCATIGDAFAQASIALRAVVAAPVAAALAEMGRREALVALAVNPGADLPDYSARRIVERFGHDAEIREALLERAGLAAEVRSDLVMATAKALGALVEDRGWLSSERKTRLLRDASDRANLIIAADAPQGDAGCGMRALVKHLRASGQLTPSLILRAMLSGNSALFETALVELSGLPERKALALARQTGGNGFATLYRAAKMPASLLPAFQAALSASAEIAGHRVSAVLSRTAVERVLRACEALNPGETNALLALLRRFEAEAAREEARASVEELRASNVQILPSVDPYLGSPLRPAIEIDLVRFEADLIAA